MWKVLAGTNCSTAVKLGCRVVRWRETFAGKGKGKAMPLQAWTGPEGSRRFVLPDFKTFGI